MQKITFNSLNRFISLFLLCLAQCFRGQFSNSGFDLPANLEPCEPCPLNTYQNQTGQKGCEKCPNGTTTHGSGSTSVSDCGGKHDILP